VHVFNAFSIWWTYNCPVANRLDNNSSRFAALRKNQIFADRSDPPFLLLAARSSAEGQRGDYIYLLLSIFKGFCISTLNSYNLPKITKRGIQ